ncbi:MAG: hypothetical protein WC599_01265 [Bacteroidales bacterium]
MNLTNERRHATNVANFRFVISYVTCYGISYNPTKDPIKLPALNTLFTNAKNSLTAVYTTLALFDNATNAREIAFAPLSKLVARILNALDSADASRQVVKDAKIITGKIQGRRATLNSSEPVNISASQISFDNRIENFSKLITLLKSEPLYAPNETDLKLPSLNTLLVLLKIANTAIVNATTQLGNARINRNKILYNAGTGLYNIQLEVKKYIKSVFGATSPEYWQVRGIKFTKPR